MSTLSDGLASALSALATIKGESLSYGKTATGSFTALTGWCLHKDRVQAFGTDNDREIETQAQTATAKGPLTPALYAGLFIKDASITPAEVYAVESVKAEAQQICGCKRVTLGRAGPDRHGAS